MSFRNLYVENPAKLSVRNKQLIISQEEDYQVPIEDIQSIMIESRKCSITIPAISLLAENQVAVFTCDEKHLPCSILLPIGNHSRKLQMLQYQLKMSKRTKNRIWQKIIKQKIFNQAKCLELLGCDSMSKLVNLANNVQEADKSFCESQAARIYFIELFGEGFSRHFEDVYNAALNYGYSIIRGVIARDLVSHGLEASLGIFHHNELNAFNLADDFIEPYRPFVDLWVAQNIYDIDCALTSKHKRELLALLYTCVEIDGEKHSLANAVRKTIDSFVACCKNNSGAGIKLPHLLPLIPHEYE